MAKKACRSSLRREPVDQINTLPDDVLLRILSLVPTEQAVTTSFLSKRWKSLWTLLPALDFDYVRFCEKFNALSPYDRRRRFLDFVQHVFFLHEHQPLHNLRLAFDINEFNNNYVSEATLLVKSAMRSNCLTIDLDFNSQTEFPRYTTLPQCFFPHPSVSQLKLTRLNDLVSKCPCLKELHLIHCQIPSSFFELNTPGSNLKCLVLKNCVGNGGHSFEHASIDIPTLLQLHYSGAFSSGYLSVCNSKNLLEAEIDIWYRLHYEYKSLCKLLKDLQNVKFLTLSLSNLKVCYRALGLLISNPILRMKYYPQYIYNVDEEVVLQPHLLPSECVAHLRRIEIENFQGSKDEMELVKLILLSSLCLKEMVICMNSRYHYLKQRMGKEHSKTLKKKQAETIKKLLACTRASPDAKILLK
ncbi:hypothetical protein MKW94_022988 [Papaver nudicaule]|uniref:F-box domain-containing protein n=1 Tax=Papaver nudicaule TaxID=74823 RepID=A0AA41V5L8_PAPNU|nr:hypothetical protein [Papaver nudicaule]